MPSSDDIGKKLSGSGFRFNCSKNGIGTSRLILEPEVKDIGPTKFNRDMICVRCLKCQVYMNYIPEEKHGYWICPSCQRKVREMTAYDHLSRENDKFNVSLELSEDDIPEGCRACGGPWPDCIDSCPIFEDLT